MEKIKMFYDFGTGEMCPVVTEKTKQYDEESLSRVNERILEVRQIRVTFAGDRDVLDIIAQTEKGLLARREYICPNYSQCDKYINRIIDKEDDDKNPWFSVHASNEQSVRFLLRYYGYTTSEYIAVRGNGRVKFTINLHEMTRIYQYGY